MIRIGDKIVLQIQKQITDIITGESVQKNIGAIYKGTQLVWRTVYSAIKSCFGSGTWKQDKPWLGSDTWKNN